jgi:serine/threonine-protein kinase
LAAAAPTTTVAPHVSASTGGAAHATTRTASADAQGLLTVVCTPACDQVIDNGKLLGPAPIFRLKVATGEHHLQLKNGRQTRVSNTIVTAGDLRSVVVTMQ